jgi:hypothetical protein
MDLKRYRFKDFDSFEVKKFYANKEEEFKGRSSNNKTKGRSRTKCDRCGIEIPDPPAEAPYCDFLCYWCYDIVAYLTKGEVTEDWKLVTQLQQEALRN